MFYYKTTPTPTNSGCVVEWEFEVRDDDVLVATKFEHTLQGRRRQVEVVETAPTYFLGTCHRCRSIKRFAGYVTGGGWFRFPVETGKPLVGKHNITCSCGGTFQLRRIEGRYNPTKACDGRCMSAKGPQCECSCGGKNHGANWG